MNYHFWKFSLPVDLDKTTIIKIWLSFQLDGWILFWQDIAMKRLTETTGFEYNYHRLLMLNYDDSLMILLKWRWSSWYRYCIIDEHLLNAIVYSLIDSSLGAHVIIGDGSATSYRLLDSYWRFAWWWYGSVNLQHIFVDSSISSIVRMQ